MSHLGTPLECQVHEQHSLSFLNQKGYTFVGTHLEGRAPAPKFPRGCPGHVSGKSELIQCMHGWVCWTLWWTRVRLSHEF